MSKYLRKYNEKTGKWEIISPTSTDDICVSNTQFNNETTPISKLTDVLNGIGDDISKLKRNVSWLAEHGGGGGGIGSGNTTNYKVVIMNAGVTNDTLYVNESKFSVTFKITGGSINDMIDYRVIYDGSYINNAYTKVKVNTNVTIDIDDIEKYSKVTPHTFIIEAVDGDGMTIPPYTLSIVETSIKVLCDDANILTIGGDGIFNIYVTNKILNSETNVKIINTSFNSQEYTYSYRSTSTAETIIPINFYKYLIDEAQVSVGNVYSLKIEVQTTTSEGTPINSSPVYTNIMIQGSNKIVINLQSLTTDEEYDANKDKGSEFATGGNITFGFTPYLIDNLVIYYAVQLESAMSSSNNAKIDIAGYYDLIDQETGENKLYSDNQSMTTGTLKTISWNVPEDENLIGEWLVKVKCWSSTGKISSEKIGKCRIINSSVDIFPTQIPIRGNASEVGNTQYAYWDLTNMPANNSVSKTWKSEVYNYLPPSYTNEEEDTISSSTTMEIFNTNGEENGFKYSPSMFLRLSSEAYAKIPTNLDESWVNKDGFTISLTFKTDFHPYNDRTVMFLGDVKSGTNEFYNGIKIDLENVYWYFTSISKNNEEISHRMVVPIRQNTMNTVDFVYTHTRKSDGTNDGMAKIFINGKIYSAVEADNYQSSLPNTMYLGCAYSSGTGSTFNYADVNISSLRIFSKALNDMEVVVNSHNARAERDENNNIITEKYDEWKKRNYFITNEDNIPKSSIYNLIENQYKYTCPGYVTLTGENPPLPVLWLDGTKSTFTREMYESTSNDANITKVIHSGFTMHYYDPNALNDEGGKGKHVTSDDIGIAIQGTSTTTLRSKNLEMYFQEELSNYSDGRTALFQPKDDWFPESQFTLKADVVDSSHANNATLGRWINTEGRTILEDTPPMHAVRNNPPKDEVVSNDGEILTFEPKQTKPTVKHTLEGFQIILMVTFKNETSPEMLGVYSFNLGRYSYYNMGLSFFKSFSRRKKNEITGEWIESSAPAVIRNYDFYKREETFEGIKLNEIFSFEFGSDADNNNEKHCTWSQDSLSILKHIGSFRFNGINGDDSIPDEITWLTLQRLFAATARMPNASDIYEYTGTSYINTGQRYDADKNRASEMLVKRLSIKNAIAYFVIANAFGMVDSLGKNFTIRSWDAKYGDDNDDNNKWYPCFYDMDTALGLTNSGDESVTPTVYIDKYENRVINEENPEPNNIIISRNVKQENGFGAYNLKLWNILRATADNGDKSDFVSTGVYTGPLYEATWRILRQEGSPLSSQDKFIDLFTEQTKECGELLYNLDYNVKYLTKYKTFSGVEAYGNIEMLHGDRVEYIRNWLKDRFYYLDGIFEVLGITDERLPYYGKGYITCGGPENGGYPRLTLNTTSPTILTVEIGQNGQIFKYFLPSYTDTDIILPPLSSDSKRIGINSTKLLTKIDGLKDIRFQKFESMSLPKFSQIDLSNIRTLTSNNPVDFSKVFVSNETGTLTSDIRDINLYNATGTNSFPVTITNYNKVKRVDIRNSCVTSLSLPEAPLSSLLFSNSDITGLTINAQPYLSNLDFSNCSQLQSVKLNECNNLEVLNINSLPILSHISITKCANMRVINCSDNKELKTFTIEGLTNLQEINLSGCTNTELTISIKGCNNLVKINFKDVKTNKTIVLPETLDKVTYLNLNGCANITGFKYGDINSEVDTYNGEEVLDLRPFKNLTGPNLNLQNCNNLKYVKFENDENKPFELGTSFFKSCSLLTRVFGNVALTGTSVFNDCTNFYIHDLPEGEIIDLPEENYFYTATDGNVTNISVKTTSLSQCFRYTNCNLHDVYYILQKCDNVTSLSGTFSYCKNINTSIKNSLNRDTFKHCGKVTSINDLFYSTGMVSILRSPKIDSSGNIKEPGLLTYCYSLQNMSNAFGTSYIDDKFFYKALNNNNELKDIPLTIIAWFSPQIIIDTTDANVYNTNSETITNYYGYASSNNLFTHLSNLTTISYSFNGIRCEFKDDKYVTYDDKVYYYTDLFVNNVKLQTISNSFTNIYGKGNIRNLFGGYKATMELMPNKFPKTLKTISGSFTFNSNSTTTTNMFIGNSLLQRIKNSIEYITDGTANNTSTNVSSFNGTTLIKYIDKEDEEYVLFPYNIFKGCSKLKEIPAFFRKLRRVEGQDNSIVVSLPTYVDDNQITRSMFEDTKELTNISYLFSEMTIPYKLTGKAFKNCQLKNVHGAFYEPDDNQLTKGYKEGYIPYGLFFEERKGSYTTMVGLTEEMANELGIDVTYGIKNCKFDSEGKVIVEFENGKIISGGTYPDGVIIKHEIDENGIIWDGTGTTTEKLTDDYRPLPTNTYTHKGTYNTYSTTISDMGECFKNSSSKGLKPYTCETESFSYDATNQIYDCGDLVIDNEAYNPIKYILNSDFDPVLKVFNDLTKEYEINEKYDPRRIIENKKFNPYKKKWNKWIADGSTELAERIIESQLYKSVADGVNKDLSIDDFPVELTIGYINDKTPINTDISNSSNDRYNERKYICPPDLFRYCKNDSITKIDGIFEACCGPDQFHPNYDTDSHIEYGFYGVIPPYLFEPLTEITSLNKVFYKCKNILPYKWATSLDPNGIMYAPELLSKLNKLEDISYLFAYNRIYNGCNIESTQFSQNAKLKNISHLFHNTIWGTDEKAQIDEGIFTSNKSIKNVSYMFCSDDTLGNNRTPRIISSGLFMPNIHKSIENCSSFMYNAKNIKGSVPEFWKWPTSTMTQITACYRNIDEAKITNSGDIDSRFK